MCAAPVNSNRPINQPTVNDPVARVNKFMDHTLEMVTILTNQYSRLGIAEVPEIFSEAMTSINESRADIIRALPEKETLSKKEIKELNVLLKSSEEKVIQKLQEALIKLVQQKAGYTVGKESHYIRLLAFGGLRAKYVKVLGHLTSAISSANVAQRTFHQAKNELLQAGTSTEFDPNALDQIGKEKHAEFLDALADADPKALARRHGVLYHESFQIVKLTFSPVKIRKQLKSLDAQMLSSKPRAAITKTLALEEKHFVSRLTPLNAEFDKTTAVFGNVFGNSGISAANRQEAHLVNGYDSRMRGASGPIFSALRHGILSDKHERNAELRKKNSEAAASELVMAAFMKQCERLDMTLEDAAHANPPVALVLNSVSLVTPDFARTIGTHGANERTMLEDQMAAFRSLEGNPTTITVGGQEIQINLKVNAFNFGVNAGAVGKLSWAPGVKLGLDRQYQHNVRAFGGLRAQYEAILPQVQDAATKQKMTALMRDINLMMRDKKAYLEGGNQYEIGAKILLLTNMMNNVAGGAEGAMNCMSGKDRTGVMDAVARAFAVMNEVNGKFPDHNQLLYNEDVKAQFREIFAKMLEEYGGMEITGINTGALGFKVGEEASLYGLEKDVFTVIQGLSKTTSA